MTVLWPRSLLRVSRRGTAGSAEPVGHAVFHHQDLSAGLHFRGPGGVRSYDKLWNVARGHDGRGQAQHRIEGTCQRAQRGVVQALVVRREVAVGSGSVRAHLEASPTLAAAHESHPGNSSPIRRRGTSPCTKDFRFGAGQNHDHWGVYCGYSTVRFHHGKQMPIRVAPAVVDRAFNAWIVNQALAAHTAALPGDGQQTLRVRGVVDRQVWIEGRHRRPAGVATQPVAVQTGVDSGVASGIGARVTVRIRPRVTGSVSARIPARIGSRIGPWMGRAATATSEPGAEDQ